jgi:hypothetical protein
VFSLFAGRKLKESPRRRRKALQTPSHRLWLRKLLPLLLKLARQFKTGCNIFWNNLSFKLVYFGSVISYLENICLTLALRCAFVRFMENFV